jgi:hypothetical protein
MSGVAKAVAGHFVARRICSPLLLVARALRKFVGIRGPDWKLRDSDPCRQIGRASRVTELSRLIVMPFLS